jgi:hypothetical protein
MFSLKFGGKRTLPEKLCSPQADVVEAEADLLDLGVPLEGDPASPEESALRLRLRERAPQKSGIP